MEDWKLIRLGDVISIKSGFAYKGEYIGNGDAYLLGMGCVSYKDIFLLSGARKYNGEAPERYLAKPGDIVLATRQQSDNLPILGMPAMIPYSFNGEKVIIGANLYRVENHSDISNEFLFWLLKSPAYVAHIRSCQTGTTVRMITKANIEDFTFLCPPKSERQRIASTLWNIEKKIELNNRINHNLEEQAQALYKSWFIDFEPFKNGKFIESEFGMIPEGWSVKELNDVTIEMRDKVKDRTDVKVLSPVNTGKLMLSEEFFTKQVFSESIAKYLLVEPLDFAYNPARVNIGSIGCNTFGFTGCVSPVYVVFRCQEKYHNFFDLFRNTQAFKEEVLARSIGGVRQTLGYKDFSLIKLIYPPLDVVIRFNSIYDEIVGQQKHILNENDNLASLRDSLLPRLMSGELTC